MELRHLRYFLAVAEEMHFGRAAKRLHISQPPLSQQIRMLEEELGVSLFDRSRRKVELSEAGLAFLPEARAALERSQRAILMAQRAGRGEAGELRIGYSGSATFHPQVARLLGQFRTDYPEVRLVVSDLPTRAQEPALLDGTLDLGIVRPPLEHGSRDLEVTSIAEETMCVAMPKEHRLAKHKRLRLEQLAEEAFVLYHRSANQSTFDRIVSACEKAGFAPKVAQEAPHFASVIGMVAAGLGIALVPDSVSRLAAQGVRYCPLEGLRPTLSLGVAWKRGNRSALLASFERSLGKVLGKD